jgi:hypothetical protein
MSKRFEEVREQVRTNIVRLKNICLYELEATNDRGVWCNLMQEADKCFIKVNHLIYENGMTILDKAKLMRYNKVAHDLRNRCYMKYKVLQSNCELKSIIEEISIEYSKNDKQFFDRINIAYEVWYESNKSNLESFDFAQNFEISY